MVDLVRAERDPTDPACEFEPSRQTIQNWFAEAERDITGWAMINHLRSGLALDALEMAVTQREPRDVIHDSE